MEDEINRVALATLFFIIHSHNIRIKTYKGVDIMNEKYKREEIDKLEGDNIEIIDKPSTLKDLEIEWDQFNSMTKKHRRVSDWKSLELFGMTNQEHYDKIKSQLLAKDDFEIEDIPLEEAYEMIKTPITKILKYGESEIEAAKLWGLESMRVIIIPMASEQELDNLWNEWNDMKKQNRRESDWKSLELFGATNKEHYEIMKTKWLKKDIDDDPAEIIGEPNSVPSEDSTTPEPPTLPKILTPTIFESDSYIEKLCRYTKHVHDRSEKISCCLELSNIQDTTNYEETLIQNTLNDTIELFKDNMTNSIGKEILFADLPFFEPTDMIDMGVHSSEPYYLLQPDNKYLDDGTISTKTWFENYKKLMYGALTEDMKNLTQLWVHKLTELYYDYDSIKKSGDQNKINARKQSILELGWNPELDFSLETRIKVSDRMKRLVQEKYKDTTIIDIKNITENIVDNDQILVESVREDNALYPIFIVLVYTESMFGKAIVRVTKGKYSHSAIGFEPDLSKLYTFKNHLYNAGLAMESLKFYIEKNKDSIMSVYAVFVKKKDLLTISEKVDYYILNKDKTHYSVINLFGILTNNVINIDMRMICSQFVDSLLKLVGVDITGKNSAIVAPNDFTRVTNKKVYNIYEGRCADYDVRKINKALSLIRNKVEYVKEGLLEGTFFKKIVTPLISASIVTEAKEFPVQFDKDGNLLIRKMKSLDFENEYAQIHKLMLVYAEKNNPEAIKYELSKLWFMNILLEKKIYTKGKNTDEQLDSYHKARAKILNDFNKYLKVVLKDDVEFNFTEYYNDSPFSDATTKINASTLKYSGDLIKSILLK
ncbi:MAG: hypothetical protein M0P49_03970 [Bacilli bacterium]|nr:hypothetical protein [Bacilli bacterium]